MPQFGMGNKGGVNPKRHPSSYQTLFSTPTYFHSGSSLLQTIHNAAIYDNPLLSLQVLENPCQYLPCGTWNLKIAYETESR
ncbi:hypothetical protein ABKN59_009612 [Abortiporus biennis]